MSRNLKNRVGEIKYGNYGLMKIIEYNNAGDIKVKFKTGTIKKTTYSKFEKGQIKDPMFPVVCGIGYIGIGKFKTSINGKITTEYKTWSNMIQRCYGTYMINKRPNYQDVFVCDSWLNFQNFAEWFYKNYYTISGERVELDKDIIEQNNKIYSPEFCAFVPQSINTLIIKRDNFRGNYPIGVCFHKSIDKYMSQISIDGKRKRLGFFNNTIDAFNAYKKAKEEQIKIMANKYKGVLNIKVYDSLMDYKVEITD